jgi:calreticulin
MIDNPEFKGAWKAPMIDNPEYKGEWEHPMIANAAYAPASYAQYSDLTTVGFELWVVNKGTIFDNILITDDAEYAAAMAAKTFEKISPGEKDAKEAYTKAQEPEKDESADAEEDSEAGEEAEEEPHDKL